MTAPFMAVGTEDSIHNGAALMRRTAHVSSSEYDIVLSVPASERLHAIAHDAPRLTTGSTMKMLFFFFFLAEKRGPECTLVWVMEQLQAVIKVVETPERWTL